MGPLTLFLSGGYQIDSHCHCVYVPGQVCSWTATILGHDEEIYSTEAATEIPIC